MSIDRELTSKILGLERRLEEISTREYPAACQLYFVIASSAGVLTPFINSASWEGQLHSGSGTIDWNAVFGVPTSSSAVYIYNSVKDAASGVAFIMRSSITSCPCFANRTHEADEYNDNHGIVTASSGSSQWSVSSGSMDEIYMRVVGYFI